MSASEAAYPHFESGETGTRPGLTKRELFAAMAMQGLCSNPSIDELDTSEIAWDAVKYADALLTQLAKEPT